MEHYGIEYLLPGLAAFVMAAPLGALLIPVLRRIKAGQTVREEGPESHLKKTGTPTMGGFIFLIPFIAVCLWCLANGRGDKGMVNLLISVVGFSLIGFIDDFIKVVLKRSMGLRAWQKFSLQTLLAVGMVAYAVKVMHLPTAMHIPFINAQVDFGGFACVLWVIMILGTVNGSNFTDGLDGLATSVTIVICIFLTLAAVSIADGSYIASSAMIGALMGFLLYNSHKASVFMGDTGSLALGGFVAACAMNMGLTLFIPVIAFIYLAEVASVIIQVSYFKITKGKRIFKMAPIHHHFELCGWLETKVVNVFSIVTAVLCALALFNFTFRG